MMRATQLLKRGKRYWKRQAFILLLFMGSTAASAALPFLIREFIDAVTAGSLLVETAVLIFAIGSLSSLLGFVGNYLFQVLAMEGIKDLQVEIYTNVQKAPIKYILGEKAGDIMSRITSDTQIVGQMIAMGIPMLLLNIVRFSVVILVLAALDVSLSLITFVSVPFYYLVFRTYNKKLRVSTQHERQAFGRVVESLREKLQGLVTIKLFNAQDMYQKQFSDDAEFWFGKVKKRTLNNMLSINLIGYITSIMPIIVFLLGGYRVIAGVLTIGTLIGFWQYMGGLYEPIRNLAEWNNALQQSVSTSERISYLLDMEKEKEGGDFVSRDHVGVSADRVSFSYNTAKALESVTFDVDSGSIVAIVGGSGAGKTTLIKLLMAFYPPVEGELKINQKGIHQYDVADLRTVISYVQQKDFIFNTSIRENITMGQPFSDAKVKEYSGYCLVNDFVEKLPQGYDTRIGEGGFDLSDGQKQRIAFARALIREPHILILDEATSAIDSEKEAQILRNIRDKMKGTIIVVSHRLSTIKAADKILVFDKGHLVAEGDHETLKRESDAYNQLFREQLIIE
ncbi:MAG: ABC transporter ATP-binding protein [Theionarchaea archaeon]|nr:ABC transporter ATP-binding protein [Theionarchaea archaeon]